jgi:hypothetical protein
MDHFGDALRDSHENYDTYAQHGESLSIATGYTSGIPASQPSPMPDSYGQTEAETLASQYNHSSSLRPHNAVDSETNSINRFTYIDEDFNYYPSKPLPTIDDKPDAGLVQNAADVGRSGTYQDLEYAEPHEDNSKAAAEDVPLTSFMEREKYPLDQRIENKKRGIGRQRYPFLCTSFHLHDK